VIGGFSPELDRREVGINRDAIQYNTELVGYHDTVILRRVRGGKIKPFFMKRPYTLIPLDEQTPASVEKSRSGEVVLSEKLLDELEKKNIIRNPYMTPCIGEEILINSTVTKLLNERWLERMAAKYFGRVN
jgi:hypothetical protein